MRPRGRYWASRKHELKDKETTVSLPRCKRELREKPQTCSPVGKVIDGGERVGINWASVLRESSQVTFSMRNDGKTNAFNK
jgi:hypothetical protein